MRPILSAVAVLAAAFTAVAEPYRVIVPMTPDDEGAMVRMVNFDTGETVDSTLVHETAAIFQGDIDEPILAMVVSDSGRKPVFVLESGTIALSKEGEFFGTMLNDSYRDFTHSLQELAGRYRMAQTPAQAAAIEAQFHDAIKKAFEENSDNPLGLFYFRQMGIENMPLAEFDSYLDRYPVLKASESLRKYRGELVKLDSTREGKMFTDFEVTYDGKTKRLSDYVGKGHYTLVDFWASWCGPCARQVPVLKDIYNEYKDKGLDVLGVAVWDKPEDTKRAIVQHGLPWDNIIDAQQIPTDIYGITGIPCIILFGPDGTILSRGLQGDALREAVAKYLGK